MSKFKACLIYVLGSVFLFSCQGTDEIGKIKVVSKFTNGEPREMKIYSLGEDSLSVFLGYHSNGVLSGKGCFFCDEKVGEWVCYDSLGGECSREYFENPKVTSYPVFEIYNTLERNRKLLLPHKILTEPLE